MPSTPLEDKAFAPLTTESVIDYLANIKEMREILGITEAEEGEVKGAGRHEKYKAQLVAEEIGDGNLNLVFVVSSKQDKSRKVIVKQSLPHLRCVGPEEPLAIERMHYEIKALGKFAELARDHVPRVFRKDEKNFLVVMEFLDGQIMRKGMIDGIRYPKFAEHLSSFLAATLFNTSSLCSKATNRALVKEFNSNPLRKLTEDYVFTFPFQKDGKNNNVPPKLRAEVAKTIWDNDEFLQKVAELLKKFMEQQDALIHADLHTGSIFVTQAKTRVIDPEFAYVGPYGFDLGAVIGNLVMSWVSHFERSSDNSYQEWILATIKEFWQKFEEKFLELWREHAAKNGLPSPSEAEQKELMTRMLQDTIGFAGCKIARRQLGVAGVEDLRGLKTEADDKEKAVEEKSESKFVKVTRMALEIGREFVVKHQSFDKIEDVEVILRQFAKKHYPARSVEEQKGDKIPASREAIKVAVAAMAANPRLSAVSAARPPEPSPVPGVAADPKVVARPVVS